MFLHVEKILNKTNQILRKPNLYENPSKGNECYNSISKLFGLNFYFILSSKVFRRLLPIPAAQEKHTKSNSGKGISVLGKRK